MTPETPCLHCGGQSADPWLQSGVHLAPGGGERFRFVRCRGCRLLYLEPRPDPEAMARYYPPEYPSHRGPEAWGWGRPLVARSQRKLEARRVRRVLRHRPLGSGDVALDVGCGRPTFLQALQERTGARCVGIDPAVDASPGDQALHLVQGTVTERRDELRDLAGRDGFRSITLWHALEHDPEPLDTLRELNRLAAPDALLLVEVPDTASLSARAQGEHWGGLHTPRHTVLFEPETLRSMVEAGGWSVEAQERHGTLDPWILWWLGARARAGDHLDGPLAPYLPGFLMGKLVAWPFTLLQRWIPLGIQSLAARRDAGG